MTIGTVTSSTSTRCATIASSTTSYAPGRSTLASTSASTITMIPSAPGLLLDSPSTRELANTNDTSAPPTRGATDADCCYPADSIGHKNYFAAPLAPLRWGGWSTLYRHAHSSLAIKRDSDHLTDGSDLSNSNSE